MQKRFELKFQVRLLKVRLKCSAAATSESEEKKKLITGMEDAGGVLHRAVDESNNKARLLLDLAEKTGNQMCNGIKEVISRLLMETSKLPQIKNELDGLTVSPGN